MKILLNYIQFMVLALILSACQNQAADSHHDHGEESASTDEVHLLQEQMDVMGIETGSFQEINLKTTIKANGQLELPPQNKASVSALMAGRVKSVKVTVGNYVKKGQVLARLEHPDYLEMQEAFLETYTHLDFLENEYLRKKQLLADSITAVKTYEESESNYKRAKVKLNSLKAKLELLGINVSSLKSGNIVSSIPVSSPISGYVHQVEINMGMSIQPEQELFEIVDLDHIHMDLMVYEKDIDRVEIGQKVLFSLNSKPDQVFEGKVFASGKAFEDDPKAVIVHAEIENKTGNLLPGMYVDARIETNAEKVRALPDEALIEDGGLPYIFVRFELRQESGHSHSGEDHGHAHASKDQHDHGTKGKDHGHSHGESDHDDHDHDKKEEDHGHAHAEGDHSDHEHGSTEKKGHSHDAEAIEHGHSHGEESKKTHTHAEEDSHKGEFLFRKIEVSTGVRDIGFTEVVPVQPIPPNAQVVTKGAFYLLAELKKGETGHDHHH